MLAFDRGAFAEHVIVKDNEAAPKPKSIDCLVAAGVPLAGLTVGRGCSEWRAMHGKTSLELAIL
jgi:NADPH:quinone reductase-like Zn-dependent oxidoreductase